MSGSRSRSLGGSSIIEINPETSVAEFKENGHSDRKTLSMVHFTEIGGLELKLVDPNLSEPLYESELILRDGAGKLLKRIPCPESGQSRRVGRDDLAPGSKHVSREHFKIRRDGNAYYVSNLSEKLETCVNGVKITAEKKLNDRDLIAAGDFNLEFCNFVERARQSDVGPVHGPANGPETGADGPPDTVRKPPETGGGVPPLEHEDPEDPIRPARRGVVVFATLVIVALLALLVYLIVS